MIKQECAVKRAAFSYCRSQKGAAVTTIKTDLEHTHRNTSNCPIRQIGPHFASDKDCSKALVEALCSAPAVRQAADEVYVASICVHVNPQQAVRAMIEADAYPGAGEVPPRLSKLQLHHWHFFYWCFMGKEQAGDVL